MGDPVGGSEVADRFSGANRFANPSAGNLVCFAERYAARCERVGKLGRQKEVARSELAHPLPVQGQTGQERRERGQGGGERGPHPKKWLLVQLQIFVVSQRQAL